MLVRARLGKSRLSTQLANESLARSVLWLSKRKKSVIRRTDGAVKTVESWWALGSALWEARGFVTIISTTAALFASAVYSVFDWINAFGWAGWVLAAIPGFIVSALLANLAHWVWHKMKLRSIAEAVANNRVNEDIEEADDDLKTHVSEQIESLRNEQRDFIRNAESVFRALDQKDSIDAHLREISVRQYDLYRPMNAKGKPFNYDQWQEGWEIWKSIVERFCATLQKHYEEGDLWEKVETVSVQKMKDYEWDFDEAIFPTLESIENFKMFRLQHMNYQEHVIGKALKAYRATTRIEERFRDFGHR